MRLQKKSLSRVSLLDLLRRRRTNLTKFLESSGIVTYEFLVVRCSSMGVIPPTEAQFLEAMGNHPTPVLSSPAEGIIVLEPPPLDPAISEYTPTEAEFQEAVDKVNELSAQTQTNKKRSKKKVESVPV